jgi:lipoprotein-anchoring transpeptidase ErfK/SrfK
MAVGALGVSACSSSGSGSSVTVTQTRSASAPATASGAPSSAPASSTSSSAKPGVPVHVSTALGDGQQVGVGMPIIAFLSRPIKDARAFAAATKVTVNGTAVSGGWYFEPKSGDPATPIEMDYRTANYWPGHAQIHMDLPVKGLSAGTGLAFDNNLTLDFTTGPANILTVDDATHKVTVRSDGSVWGTFPTSLGSTKTPTKRGVKVIMEKGKDISMKGPGYYDPHVKWTQRLTYDGEYLHAAPWNSYNIEHGIDTSNGCTNLTDSDAKRLYATLRVGDVVDYPNASGPKMSLGDGYGDWNVPWSTWLTGGAVPTG